MTPSTSHHNLQKDVIVIGGGHAGCEAALAAARLGAETLLLTINSDHIAQMSCNPAIGGIAKGQVVREIDALGGEMGITADIATIQFRMLNLSKGPAVQSPRAQCDKMIYQQHMKYVLENQPGLAVHQARVNSLKTDDQNRITGVVTDFGDVWKAKAVIIATGTFLQGKLHYGMQTVNGGRAGDPAAEELAQVLRNDLKLQTGRLKTGTPPRLLGNSIDFKSMQRQDADDNPQRFSFRPDRNTLASPAEGKLPALPCYITESTPETAKIIRDNLEQSPMYQGRIEGIGARYCPSFEDKIARFPDRETHQIYLEPEGAFTNEYYLNGISTSLPPHIQWQMIRSLPGMKNAKISRYAYAIEYDFVYHHQLDITMALRNWHNLFLAGQINGTSGYEEAAGQGLVSGINAARQALGNEEPFILRRDQAYIGVMLDDLVTKEIVEPYRLFTSRAEYRLMLRQDNADRRLTPLGYQAGLVSQSQHDDLQEYEKEIRRVTDLLKNTSRSGTTLWELLRRPDVSYTDIEDAPQTSTDVIKQVQNDALYEGYIQRQSAQVENMRDLESWIIPDNFDYQKVKGIRTEARHKLEKMRPRNLDQASRIDGVTPAEISLLQVYLK